MYYVYLLRSVSRPEKTYVGFTQLKLEARLLEYNQGKSKYTLRFMPWDLVACVGVRDRQKAVELESYFKTGSGHAFAAKHLWT